MWALFLVLFSSIWRPWVIDVQRKCVIIHNQVQYLKAILIIDEAHLAVEFEMSLHPEFKQLCQFFDSSLKSHPGYEYLLIPTLVMMATCSVDMMIWSWILHTNLDLRCPHCNGYRLIQMTSNVKMLLLSLKLPTFLKHS